MLTTLPSSLFNASVVSYDPYAREVLDILELSGITHNPALHLGGVAADPYSDLLTIVVDAAAPFATGGRDVSGDNFLLKYNPDARAILWRLNLTATSKGRYGGFQDVETDSRGNTYVVGTFPGTILRVDSAGSSVQEWYLPNPLEPTKAGYAGLAAVPGTDVLLTNGADGGIYRFDMAAATGTPVLVTRPAGDDLKGSDAIYLPARYNGRILLAAEPGKGVSVLRSQDGWQTARYLGRVANNFPEANGGSITATVQIGNNVFAVVEYFTDPPVAGSSAGNRTQFPLIDITAHIQELFGDR